MNFKGIPIHICEKSPKEGFYIANSVCPFCHQLVVPMQYAKEWPRMPKEGKYPVFAEDEDKLKNSFTYHAPKGDQQERYVKLRENALALGLLILENVPPCAERTLAVRKIEESIMWANKAIACNE